MVAAKKSTEQAPETEVEAVQAALAPAAPDEPKGAAKAALDALVSRQDVMETVPEARVEVTAVAPSEDVIPAGGNVEVTLALAAGVAFKDGDLVQFVNAERGQRLKVSQAEADRLRSLGAVVED